MRDNRWWVLGGMQGCWLQFGALVQVLLGAGAGAVLGCYLRYGVGAFLRENRRRVLGGMQFGLLVQVLLEVWVQVHFGEIDGRVLGGTQFGVGYFEGALSAGCFGGGG